MVCMGWTEQTNGISISSMQSVSETDKTKVLWDFNIQGAHVTEARRPNIMVVGKEDRVCKIIDVAEPADCRVNAKESEKN